MELVLLGLVGAVFLLTFFVILGNYYKVVINTLIYKSNSYAF